MINLRPYQTDTLRKMAQAFTQGYRRPCVASACGSGKTVMFAWMAQTIQEKGRVVWFLVHRRELLDQTTETFNRFGIERRSIYIGMVGTFGNHLNEYPSPHTIIFDECHFSTAKTWQKIIEAFPKAYIIGLTATPCRLDGKPLASIYDILIEGPQAAELIQSGYLSPYSYYAPNVADLSALRRKGSDFDAEQASDILMERVVFGDVIHHYKTLASGKKAICYCSSIRHSQAMALEFKAAGINAVHFDGDTPKKARKQIIEDFRSGHIQILCNVDLISVGFDCPDCECCILLRPTMSTALYIQQACRALRPAPGKKAIILDHVGNVLRHGLPDEIRNWTLDSGMQKRKTYTDTGRLAIRTCLKCYSAYDGRLHACPYCGEPAKITAQEIKNIKAIQLQEFKAKKEKEAEKSVQNVDNPDDCKTMAELLAYAKKKNYKPQWAYFIAKSRGWNLAKQKRA